MTFRAPDIGELTFDEHAPPVVFQRGANRAVDFAHAEDTFIAVMVTTLKTLEERHLRHELNLAAFNLMTKGTV